MTDCDVALDVLDAAIAVAERHGDPARAVQARGMQLEVTRKRLAIRGLPMMRAICPPARGARWPRSACGKFAAVSWETCSAIPPALGMGTQWSATVAPGVTIVWNTIPRSGLTVIAQPAGELRRVAVCLQGLLGARVVRAQHRRLLSPAPVHASCALWVSQCASKMTLVVPGRQVPAVEVHPSMRRLRRSNTVIPVLACAGVPEPDQVRGPNASPNSAGPRKKCMKP